MKKVEIERMQRIEEIVERQTLELKNASIQESILRGQNLKLQGANEALTELIVRLKKVE